jgi:hypothetical protein
MGAAMKTVGVFFQREANGDIEHLEIDAGQTVAQLKASIESKQSGAAGALLFLEDADEPIDEEATIQSIAGPRGVKVHVHRCRRVMAIVHFAGQTLQRAFGPGTTIARVKRWAAEQELKMSPDEASEHVLQLTGSATRPRPNTHIGTLAQCPACTVSFDLVPDQRVNGASP